MKPGSGDARPQRQGEVTGGTPGHPQLHSELEVGLGNMSLLSKSQTRG